MTQNPLKILVVEDEYITQKTICTYLTEIGYEVVSGVMNANNAIEILNTKNVDFDDAVAKQYLENLPTAEEISNSLAKLDPGKFLNAVFY